MSEQENADAYHQQFIHNCEEQLQFCAEHSVHESKKLKVEEIENGVALPPLKVKDIFRLVGGIYDVSAKATGFELFSFLDTEYDKYGIPKTEYCDETVIYGGYLHWFFSYLIYISLFERLWYVCGKVPSDKKIIFLSYGNKLSSLQKELLSCVGIPEENIMIITKPTRFKKIIVPEECIRYDVNDHTTYYTDEYLSVFNAVRENVQPAEHKKVYLTKSKHKKYGDLNVVAGEEYFENFYRDKGFLIVAPETLPIRGQISLILGADEIAGIIGTQMILAAAMARPETTIVCLGRNNETEFKEIYWHLSSQKKLRCIFVDVSINFFLPNLNDRSVYLIGVSEYWRKYVETVYHETVSETCEGTLNKYGIEYVRRWCRLYSEILPQCFSMLDKTNMIDFLDNMHCVLFGSGIDRAKFSISPSKISLIEQNALLRQQYDALLNEKNLLLAETTALEKKIKNIKEKLM